MSQLIDGLHRLEAKELLRLQKESVMVVISQINIKASLDKFIKEPNPVFPSFQDLVQSIKEHGIILPLVLTKDYKLISGYRRLFAAKELGMKEVPCTIIN